MKSKIDKRNKETISEPCLFSDTDMAGGQLKKNRSNDDIELFTDAVVEALQILEGLDKPSINQIAEECYYNSLDSEVYLKKVICLRSLPGYFFDIIQYSALEYCVQQIATPLYRWSVLMPEGCYERGLQQFTQQKHNAK